MNKIKFRTLFQLIGESRPDLSINDILRVMFEIDMKAFAEFSTSLTGTIWVKTEASVRPANLDIADVMALISSKQP